MPGIPPVGGLEGKDPLSRSCVHDTHTHGHNILLLMHMTILQTCFFISQYEYNQVSRSYTVVLYDKAHVTTMSIND